MKINRLSLLNSLFNVLNENNQGDPYFILAEYFLEHYHELSRLNIYDVAADCFVSRSSIRRFCQAIGYENFVAFKDEFAQYDDQRASFQKHAGRENYRETLTQEINAMIAELDQRMNTAEVERLAERIHDAREVVFLTSSVGATSVFFPFISSFSGLTTIKKLPYIQGCRNLFSPAFFQFDCKRLISFNKSGFPGIDSGSISEPQNDGSAC